MRPTGWRRVGSVGLVVAVLLASLTGCGSDGGEPGPTATPTVSGSGQPDGGGGDEPGTGTEVTVEVPDTTGVGQTVEVPITVTVGAHEPPWTDAALSVATEGSASATSFVDVAALAPGGVVRGGAALQIPPGSDDAPAVTRVVVTLTLSDDGTTVVTRAVNLVVLADDQQAWFSLGSEGEARRARLDDLLAAGEITRAEYEAGRAETLESGPVGTIESVAPSDDAT